MDNNKFVFFTSKLLFCYYTSPQCFIITFSFFVGWTTLGIFSELSTVGSLSLVSDSLSFNHRDGNSVYHHCAVHVHQSIAYYLIPLDPWYVTNE